MTILTALVIIGSIFLVSIIVGIIAFKSMFNALTNLDIGGPDELD